MTAGRPGKPRTLLLVFLAALVAAPAPDPRDAGASAGH